LDFAHSVLDPWINSECFNKQFVFVEETLCVFCGVGIGGLNTRIYEIHAANAVGDRNACKNCALYVACVRSQSMEYWQKATLIVRRANAGCLFKLVCSVLNKILVLTICAARMLLMV
jgi:hypothetical protein